MHKQMDDQDSPEDAGEYASLFTSNPFGRYKGRRSRVVPMSGIANIPHYSEMLRRKDEEREREQRDGQQ